MRMFITKCFAVLLGLTTNVFADIDAANALFGSGKFTQAADRYYEYAELGNPTAFYQLGDIYHRGLIGEKDSLQATIWFGLAAEQSYGDADKRMVASFKLLNASDQKLALETLQSMKRTFGYAAIMMKYFPQIKSNIRNDELLFVTSGGSVVEKLNSGFYAQSSDFEFEEVGVTDGFGASLEDDNFANLFEEGITENISDQQLFQRPYFIVADGELYPDGSARDFQHVLVMGDYRRGFTQLGWKAAETAQYKGQATNFVKRYYAGIASYDIWEMRERYEGLYNKVRRTFRKIEDSEDPTSQYLYAAGLLTFPFLPRDEGEVERRLSFAAKANVPEAQYQYALSLYMDKQIEDAILWMSKAAQNGVAMAQYKLGRWLEVSPFIQTDVTKAAFWYEKASAQNYVLASRHLARLKLTHNAPLSDVSGALTLLDAIKSEQFENPAYIYLTALANDKKPDRDRGAAVRALEQAISKAETRNWDVSNWRAQLNKWMKGNITVTDY